MWRATCAVLGLFAFLTPPVSRLAPPDIDAVTFALAFKAGNADQYKNKQISGQGVSFHGVIQERIADGSTRTSLVATLGAAAPDGKVTPIKVWDNFVAAERERTTLVVALSGPSLPSLRTDSPSAIEFSGVYDGQVRTIMRVPQSADSSTPDTGPCPGEQPQQAKGGFYCAALLTGATAQIR